MTSTPNPQKNDAKTLRFLQKLCERLVLQKKYSENIVKAVTDKLQVRADNQLVLVTIQDPIYENFIKQPEVQHEMSLLTHEIWGESVQFVLKSNALAPAKKRTSKKPAAKSPVLDSLFSQDGAIDEKIYKDDAKSEEKQSPIVDVKASATPVSRAEERNLTVAQRSAPKSSLPLQSLGPIKKKSEGAANCLPEVETGELNTGPQHPLKVERKGGSALSDLTKINRMSLLNSTQIFANSMEESGYRPSESVTGQLDPDLTFETFVQVRNNELASQACLNAARNPGRAANPVFIYGSTGLGKTHLLHAVGNEIRRSHPNWVIRYVTSEEFMLELMSAIRHHRQDEFRNKFRLVDVLLVDDIQFLEKKDSTQVEFFHTFNELYNNKKQIVITSDQYPKSIPNIEERLKSRFLQGLIASIDMPEFEDRVAIIEVKAKAFGLKLTRDQIELIATHIKSNVREITGALTTLLVHHSMNGEAPSLNCISHLLRKETHRKGGEASPGSIKKLVAQHFQVRVQDLMSTSRKEEIVLPRHIAMFLTREILGLTTTDVALEFGRRDHTTVLNASKRIAELIENDASTLASIKELRRKIELNQEL